LVGGYRIKGIESPNPTAQKTAPSSTNGNENIAAEILTE